MNRYICGLCRKRKKPIDFISNRAGLRKHLREEHFITKDIANFSLDRHESNKSKKDYWIVGEF